jgi:hypothetical protein
MAEKTQTFGEASRAARKNPDAMKRGTFTWQGKSYTTKPASEGTSSPKPAAGKSTPSSPVGDYYRNRLASDKASGDASKIRGVSAAESAAAQAKAGKSNVAPKPSAGSTTTKDNSFAARQRRKYGDSSPGNVLRAFKGLKDFNDAGLKRDVVADAKFKAQQKAKGYAKGGSIDGIAQRGKTRASMKKGK